MSDQSARSLYELIGAPLMALVDAESQAAKATANFIKEMGFSVAHPETEDTAPENFGDLKMVTFRSKKRGADGKSRSFKVEVPLLSLLPIPALQIKDAELEFLAKIIDYPKRSQIAHKPGPEEEKKPQNENETPSAEEDQIKKYSLAELPGRDLKATFGADYPDDTPSRHRRLDMVIKMKIKMQQADIPAGLGSLFNLMQENISISSTEDK
jgi:hypothetical protein